MNLRADKLLLLALLAWPSVLWAQLSPAPSSTGNITVAATTCATTNACVVIHLPNVANAASVTITGNGSGNTLQFEQSADNQVTWVAASPASTTANNTVTTFNVSGLTDFRVRESTLVSGTVTVVINVGMTQGGNVGAAANNAFTGANAFKGALTCKSYNGILCIDDANTGGWAGADVCAQTTSAIAALPATGGVIDMRGLLGTLYACTGTFTIGTSTQSVYILLPDATINPSGNPGFQISGSVFLIGVNTLNTVGGGSRLNVSVGANTTVQWQGSYGGIQDVFINSGSAAGLYLLATASIDVRGNNFRNIRTSCSGANVAGSIGVRLTSFDGNHNVTENVFGPVFSSECETDIQLDANTTQGPTDNAFNGITVSSSTGTGIAAINCIKADVNHFSFGILQNKAIGTKVVAGVHNDFNFIRYESNTVDINDAGTGTSFNSVSLSAATSTFTGTVTTMLGRSNGTYVPLNEVNGQIVPLGASVASNFTTTSVSLVTITGLSFTLPASPVGNYSFHCRLSYSQATAAAADAFGVQAATTAPANLYAAMDVSTGLAVTGVDATLPTLTTTTATNIGTFTPSAAGAIGNVPTIFVAELWGRLEQGAGATTLNIMALSGNAADALTIYRGSSCTLLP